MSRRAGNGVRYLAALNVYLGYLGIFGGFEEYRDICP